VIPEIIVLALASTVRPTSVAAVYALLSHGSRQLLWVYVIAGLAFSIAFGVIVVGVFHGIHVNAGSDLTRGVADIVGGVVVLAFAAGIATGRIGGRRGDDASGRQGSWASSLEQRLSFRTAAIAGPLTHLPGIFYLVALNVIVAHNPLLPGGVLAVLVFDVIWFALPILALGLSIVNPAAATELIVAVQRWSGRHSRTILLSTTIVVGTALLVRGVITW
jgi:hypothetical protein